MPEITAFLVNETLHQGLFFICISFPAKCFTELYFTNQSN